MLLKSAPSKGSSQAERCSQLQRATVWQSARPPSCQPPKIFVQEGVAAQERRQDTVALDAGVQSRAPEEVL
jgi:hypothetical protein